MVGKRAQIIELGQRGLSATKIAKRLGLTNVRRVNSILREELGPVNVGNNSDEHAIRSMRPLIEILLVEELGKDPFFCEVCDEGQPVRCDIHHTRYEGATLYDLQFACRSCNTSGSNKGLD